MDCFVIRKRLDGDVGTSRQPTDCTNSSVNLVPREINLDELSYGPAVRKRISEYTKDPRKQDEIRRMYLAKSLVDTIRMYIFLWSINC
jgi:hypothetical protein